MAATDAVCFNPEMTTTVETTANIVVRGALRMRPTRAGVIHTLRFVGVDESKFVGGHTMEPLATDVGLWVIEGGVWDVQGTPKRAWLRAAEPLAVGTTVIVLEDIPAGWQPGDELVVTPTLPPTVADHFDLYDYPRIQRVEGTAVFLDRPLQFAHPGVPVLPTRIMYPEILNLTRNVRVEGQPGQRAHVIFNMAGRPQQLGHYEARWLGPQQPPDADGNVDPVLGRYGLHFHRMGDAARGSLVEGVVLHDLGAQGFVAHASHGVTFRDTVLHNGYLAGYWWDDKSDVVENRSHDVLYDRAVTSRISYIPAFRGFRITGFALKAGFRNEARDAVAVGIQGSTESSGMFWPGSESGPEPGSGVWVVTGGAFHNNKHHGWFTWQNTALLHRIGEGTIAYYNGSFGLSHGAYSNSYVYEGMTLYGNRSGGILLHAVSKSRIGQTPMIFRRIRIDQAGMSDYGIVTDSHNAGTNAPTLFEDLTVLGYRKAALHVAFANSGVDADGDPKADLIDFVRYSFSGNETWLEADIHQQSVIRLFRSIGNLALRRKDQPGDYFELLWNSSVKRL